MCPSKFFLKQAVGVLLTLLMHMNGVAISSLKNVSRDHVALLAIKSKITYDPQGVFRSWNDSLPFCRWHGVTCGRRHQRVTGLKLTSMGLVGSLSPRLGNLSFLRYIYFEDNQLHGIIPPEIGRLYRLQFSVALGRNKFTGGIPPSIGNLTSLQQLYLSYCPLGGGIPASFNRLKNLREISMGENGLVGEFPLFFFNLSVLQLINFPENQLYGSLPSNLCLRIPYIQMLAIGSNHFSGFLPQSISNCTELETFDVGDNDFTGEIPIDFGKLQYLNWVFLADNSFESSGFDGMNFIDSLSNCSNLETLEFSNNKLRGMLGNSLGNFSSKLKYLGMSSNYISGGVPSSIGNLFGLTALFLTDNHFTGMIPESIGKLRNLESLFLGKNTFYGIIPPSIGNLSFVSKLAFGENKLEGTIPTTFGNCKGLQLLDLYRNNLRGSVPKELFQLSSLSIILDLSQNNLSGVLPQEIGNLKVLGQLDLSKNRLSGEFPSSFSSLISLQLLNLSGNNFHGSVPEALSSLRGLEYVDLSRNNFSGHIPTYFQNMDLYYLDLSYNNFEGEVPVEGVFANTSAIFLTENRRLCGGSPDLNLPNCTTTDSKRSRKLSVGVVVAISLSSTVAGLVLVSFVVFYCCIKKKRDKPSEIILNKSFEKISYERLFKATDGFSSENLIGTGSFALVYKGYFDEKFLTVAIKVLNLQHRGGLKSFMAECDALRNIRHRNLVKVITSCSSIDFQGNDFKALVYDFMPNGSLESWLHSVDNMLDFSQRINIIKDVACALEYLHCRCVNVVIHCDLKPSNVLLDADMVAHVGDFGLAKVLSLEEVSDANKSSSAFIRGTVGYAPPEYGLGNEVSTSGDIYSYGILLLEMLTGKKPVDPMFEEGLSLHSYARSALTNGFELQIVDPVLLNESVSEQSLISLVKIGVQCSSEAPQDRMYIGTVVHELFSMTSTTS